MSAQSDANKVSGTAVSVPESPTTARPFEMDDDDVQESTGLESSGTATAPGVASTTTTGSAAAAARAPEEAAPPKPQRPMTEAQKHQMMLKEAFPTLDDAVIRAVLTASGGKIDPAFNALLEMTDPDAASREVEEPAPPQPPRPSAVQGATAQSQLEADELYARQLAQHYENVGAYEERTSRRPARQQTGLDPSRNYRGQGSANREPERNFMDDDLPIIKENLRKGFQETQKTVNTWFQTIKKRIDEEFSDEPQQQGQQSMGRGQSSQAGRGQYGTGRASADASRRSGDYERYDADPQVLSDDFAGMKFNTDGTPVGRAQPNPNIFRPPPPSVSPKPGADGRKVAFRDGAEEIGDVYNVSPQSTGTSPAPGAGATASGNAGKPSKWQPLSTVEPSPIADNDPFSLGDSDDDKDSSHTSSGTKGHKKTASSTSGGDIKMEDAERLRKAAAEAMNDSLVDDKKKGGETTVKKD
ncbi:hypothetical protein PpBr36_07108 [Pyricularia pennisetigena]|uniref:hypothetical protein n=1 Tax=Pyricularia pennisetigena TaxID=1578925 RepID=UPI00114EFB30|nr:hypothetical protein PpBr36_07108 [Pyricularia pennisetigena]TLS26086.1 hypothetical protein PpBr36_07108 [Pyricularia pennisetigena]